MNTIESKADIGLLFHGHFTPELGLTAKHYEQAAAALNVEIAAIQAVAEVETHGRAFDDQGRPRILFERHCFHNFTDGAFDAGHPVISQRTGGGYGKFSEQYGKLEEAWKLAPGAALRSVSWGRFQIMGNNFDSAGFDTVDAMVVAHARAESEHLNAFVHFVLHNKNILQALCNKDWAQFALGYNGKNYAQNEYDSKMAHAYASIKAKAQALPPGRR